MTAPRGSLYSYQGHRPQVDPAAYIAPGARLIGRVTVRARASVWFNSVLRADVADIEVGEGSNIQDLTTLHLEGTDERFPGAPEQGVRIGRYVSVGHNCVLHSCTIEDDCLIGMHATVMSGVVIGRGSVIGAGTVVLEDTVVPPFSLVIGSPGTVRKTYSSSIIAEVIRVAADMYIDRVTLFSRELKPV